jgi:WD40 repeat protein
MIEWKKQILTFKITPDGTRIVTLSKNDGFDILDIKTGNCLNTIAIPSLKTYNSYILVGLSGDSQKIITGENDNIVRVWNIATSECQRIFQGHECCIVSVGISYDSSRVASADIRGRIIIWDTFTGQRIRDISVSDVGKTSIIKFNFDGTHILFTQDSGYGADCYSKVYILDIANTKNNGILLSCGRYHLGKTLITEVDFCYGGDLWNRHCGFLHNTHTSVIAASTKNPELPFLPTEIWEHIFEFIPIQDSVITACRDGTSAIIHL